MLKNSLKVAAVCLLVSAPLSGAFAAGAGVEPPKQEWSFSGVFGSFDRAAKQRGFQVYTEVCAGCHGLRHLAYRNLEALGYSEAQQKAYAAQFEVDALPNDDGEVLKRPAEPSDRFVEPFANPQEAAAANGGAAPPDLTLMVKARAGGADYLYALLTGYLEEAPDGFDLPVGKYYNTYYPGHAIAMGPPLLEDLIEYSDGTPATVDQMARDLTQFLAWTAEPEMEQRKSMGHAVILFLIFFTVVAYLNKRRLWAKLH